jgi:hypothetical protein
VYIGLGDTRYVEVSSIKLGEWRHYAAVYAADGSSFTMYVNGVQEAKTEHTGEARPAVANINGEALTLGQGLTLPHFSAEPEPFMTQNTPQSAPNTPYHPLSNP